MNIWKNCILADLGEIVGGATPSTRNENYYGGDIPWITPKDLSTIQSRFIHRGERNITIAGLKSCSARLMPPHSVLFTSRAPIGYVAIAENEVCTNQGFKSIVPNNTTDYLFLYYLLVYNRQKIENMGSGTTFKEISSSVMKQISVSVPTDIEEQRAISRILGVFDSTIENNTKINHHLPPTKPATESSPDIRRGRRESRVSAKKAFSMSICWMVSKIPSY
jgi:type I restriction enzyme S subunit